MHQAKTDTKYGITYAIIQEQNGISAFVDVENKSDTFDTWDAAEHWANRIIEETRVNRKTTKCSSTKSKNHQI